MCYFVGKNNVLRFCIYRNYFQQPCPINEKTQKECIYKAMVVIIFIDLSTLYIKY